MLNSKGKEVVAIVKLKSRIEGHKASITEDYQELKSIVLFMKQKETLNKWIEKKLQETFTRINENWKNCDFYYKGWIFE
jgi:peptidyl-prolyl cis-trans isomerase SurA